MPADSSLPRPSRRGVREILAGALHHSGALRGISRLRFRQSPRSLVVLAYHRLLEAAPDAATGPELFAENVIEGDRLRFEHQLRLLCAHRHVIGLDELRAALIEGAPLPPSPLLITFDDGYRSCVDVALPVLREQNLRATFFIATSPLQERQPFWWDAVSYLVKSSSLERLTLELPAPYSLDRRIPGALTEFLGTLERLTHFDLPEFLHQLADRAGVEWNRAVEERLASQLLMTWDDVKHLHSQRMDVAAHTRTHRVLHTLKPTEWEPELAGSRADLLRYAGIDTRAIAYPAGYPVQNEAALTAAVRDAGFDLGFTYGGGHNPVGRIHPLGIQRLPVNAAHSDSMHHLSVALPSLGYQSARAIGFQPPG